MFCGPCFICASMLSSICREHHIKAQTAPAQSTKASTCRPELDNASKKIWRTLSCRRAFIQLAAFSKRTKKSKSDLPTKIYNHAHRATSAGVMREGFPFISNLHKIERAEMHAASGSVSWSTELLAFARRHFAPKFVDLSVRFIRILFYILPCKRA